ncbi:CTP synthase [Bifidobacterium sp. SO1]|uniref:CTP synthase n=1 Tax=Bifidobacterium sp. SO1 TaxID=2809029 RepID=UPI001BDD0C0E|nr:CTP synthase [Bifidobacterium sp. SO1]MBT1162838.1 CTP synthase [Bifidobacterium sp. SO1]
MKTHRIIADKLMQAQRRQSCIFAANDTEGKALRRRVHAGELSSPYHGMFADARYWNALNETERVRHIARCLATRYPSWVFAGPTAAAICNLDHQWSIHRSGLYVASSISSGGTAGGVRRIFMTEIPIAEAQGLCVTSVARTLVDCALLLPFSKALPVFDSAFGNGASERDVRDVCAGLRRDTSAVSRLLSHVDPRSENGGESLARAVMIEARFQTPQLQRVFVDPRNSLHWYRVDFTWCFPGGYTVVGEYDGVGKYVDPAMTDRRSIQAVVSEQAERERDLYAWGVRHIVRFTYDDVVRRQPLIDKLASVGIPRTG